MLAGIVAALFFLAWLAFEVIATMRDRRRARESTEPG
jgi:hypothetical protein